MSWETRVYKGSTPTNRGFVINCADYLFFFKFKCTVQWADKEWINTDKTQGAHVWL